MSFSSSVTSSSPNLPMSEAIKVTQAYKVENVKTLSRRMSMLRCQAPGNDSRITFHQPPVPPGKFDGGSSCDVSVAFLMREISKPKSLIFRLAYHVVDSDHALPETAYLLSSTVLLLSCSASRPLLL